MDLYYHIPISIYGIPVLGTSYFGVHCRGCDEGNDVHGNLANIIVPRLQEMIEIRLNAKNIFFEGSIDDLEIQYDNIYYYSETEPTEEGNYWYYDSNNNPVIW